jgi:hypothetical protein
MKQYFATSLHDTEWAARQFMPAGSAPVPVYLASDVKPDTRNGRCACIWSGDKLAEVCFAHLQAVREFDRDGKRGRTFQEMHAAGPEDVAHPDC